MSFLLDTCAISEWMKLRPNAGWLAWLAQVPELHVYVSVISMAEGRHGAERVEPGAQRKRLETWLATLPNRFGERLLPVDLPVAEAWGRLKAQRDRVGRPITPFDALIAATAQVHGLSVVTRNVGDFDGCGVDLVNPWS